MSLFFLFHSFTDMSRLVLYFQIVQLFIIPFIVYYLYKNKKEVLAYIIIGVRIIFFLQLTIKEDVFGVSPIKFLI